MAFFYRTKILKIERQPIFSDINAASADVWNECCTLMRLYQWQRGYGHAHSEALKGLDSTQERLYVTETFVHLDMIIYLGIKFFVTVLLIWLIGFNVAAITRNWKSKKHAETVNDTE